MCNIVLCSYIVFFFQAEDGIRDKLVTGVQTCALPKEEDGIRDKLVTGVQTCALPICTNGPVSPITARIVRSMARCAGVAGRSMRACWIKKNAVIQCKIGRASCRERV